MVFWWEIVLISAKGGTEKKGVNQHTLGEEVRIKKKPHFNGKPPPHRNTKRSGGGKPKEKNNA